MFSRIWAFVNSSFGIFLLSSVALGLVSFSYSSWQTYEGDKRNIEKLDLEIAVRLSAIDRIYFEKESGNRYSNLVNINNIIDGAANSSFYVQKPLFNEFENKSIVTLMWQLYILVPSREKNLIRQDIGIINKISAKIREIRYNAANDLDDNRPKLKTKKEQEKRDDEDDIFKKDYGQSTVFAAIHQLANSERWRHLLSGTNTE